jgi:putative endonuclease
MRRSYFVYILASESRELCVGVTNNLWKRLSQHRSGLTLDAYSFRHRTDRLVYTEITEDILAAIRRENQIKGWTRKRKLALIEASNPDWRDLAEGLSI